MNSWYYIQGAISMTPHMSLPIGTTTASEQLKSQTLYDYIKCITVTGQMIIYVGAD